METGGLYYKRTLHTLFLRMIEILHVLCLSVSSHYGFKSSSGRLQFVHASLPYKRYHTTAGFKSRVAIHCPAASDFCEEVFQVF